MKTGTRRIEGDGVRVGGGGSMEVNIIAVLSYLSPLAFAFGVTPVGFGKRTVLSALNSMFLRLLPAD